MRKARGCVIGSQQPHQSFEGPNDLKLDEGSSQVCHPGSHMFGSNELKFVYYGILIQL